jgi:hypothetical protein
MSLVKQVGSFTADQNESCSSSAETGFNYQFDALENNGKSNELDEVFTELFHSPQANMYNVFRLSQAIMPILRLMVLILYRTVDGCGSSDVSQPGPGRNLLRAARNKMYIIGKQIVSKSKADIKAADGEESLIGKRDLLSILLKANLSTTIPETQRLNDTEVISGECIPSRQSLIIHVFM